MCINIPMLLKACKACQLWLKPPRKNTNKQLICTILAGKQLFFMVFPRMYWVEKLLRLNFSSEAILQLFDIQLIITKSILYDIWKSIFKILRYTSSVCFNIPMLFMTCKVCKLWSSTAWSLHGKTQQTADLYYLSWETAVCYAFSKKTKKLGNM